MEISDCTSAKDLSYRQTIIDRLDKQTDKGIKKYGDTIDKSGHLKSSSESLEYLAEELTDGLVYIEHTKQMMRQKEQDMKRIKNHLAMSVNALRAIAYHDSPGAVTAKKALKDMGLE